MADRNLLGLPDRSPATNLLYPNDVDPQRYATNPLYRAIMTNPVGTEYYGQSLTTPTPGVQPVAFWGGQPVSQAFRDKVDWGTSNALGWAGGTNTKLAMDAASRLARARELGFDTNRVWYHGTAGEHESFDPAFYGKVTNSAEPGTWLTDDVGYASGYAQNAQSFLGGDPRILSLYTRSKKPLVVDFTEENVPIINGKPNPEMRRNEDIVKYATRNGYDAVFFPTGNFAEPTAAAVIFDPWNLRETGASFDPAKAASTRIKD